MLKNLNTIFKHKRDVASILKHAAYQKTFIMLIKKGSQVTTNYFNN